MDAPVINIIVTIMIIFYVLKRMQEVAKKGRDITAPPIPRPSFGGGEADDEEDSFPELRQSDRGESIEGEMRHRETGRRAVHEELRPDTVQRRFEVPEEPPLPRARKAPAISKPSVRRRAADEDSIEVWPETVLAVQGEDEESRSFDRAAFRPSPSTGESQGTVRRERHKQSSRGIVPRFGRKELIRGIIMREVLGPPVGMRSGTE